MKTLTSLLLGLILWGAFQSHSYASGPVAPLSGLVGWWSGDDTAADIAGHNAGALQGGVSYAPGKVGNAFSLDGVSGYIQIANVPELNFHDETPMSVELWAFRTGMAGTMHILGKREECGDIQFQMAFDGSGLAFGGSRGAVHTGWQMPMKTWLHLAATFDGHQFRFYTNGVLAATGNGTLGAQNNSPIEIGKSGTCGGPFEGLIDEVSIYNRALSPEEVADVYAAGSKGKDKPDLPKLFTAAISGKIDDLNHFLVGDHPDLNKFNEKLGLTPYGAACMAGQPEAALAIAHHGGDVNATDADGDTILHLAAAKGWDQAVYIACAAGTDPRLRNAAGLTAHEVAAAKKNLSALARLSEAELWLTPQEPRQPALDFSVSDFDGQPVSLSSFKGRTVALFFLCSMGWDKSFHYTWLDYAQRLQDSPEGKSGKLVVLVATPDDVKSTKQFLQDRGYTFRTLSDPKDTIRKALGLYAMPAVLVDTSGVIRWQRRMWQCSKVEDHGLFLATEKVLSKQFTVLAATGSSTASNKAEQLLYDFEDGFKNWQLTGDCWETKPATDALYPGLVKGYVGRSFLSTFGSRGFQTTGLALSPEFEINKDFLHLLVGGGDFPDHCAVTLVCNGCSVRLATGRNTAELEPVCWNVHDLVGTKAHLELYDCGTAEPRDFIMLDQIVASDSASMPVSFAKRFDPNDPKDSAAVADFVPDAYKALQAGEFHEEATPGRTYRMELSKAVSWPDGPADWLEFHFDPCPTHHAQIFRSLTMTVEAGGKTYQGRPVSNGRLFEPQTWVCYIPASQVPDRHGIVKMTEVVTAKNLKILGGESPDKTQLPQYVRGALTSSNVPYTNNIVMQFLTQNKLWRWPSETDAAYFLRAYRFFQRDFSYVNVPWGGWPTPDEWSWTATCLVRRATDCGMVAPMGILLRANGIPANYEQGGWTSDNGGGGGAHVKGLTYIRNVGWLYFGVVPDVNGPWPFAVGTRQGDDFLGHRLDWFPAPQLPDPPGTTVLHGWFSANDDWWHCWVDHK